MKNLLTGIVIPSMVAIAAVALVVLWVGTGPVAELEARVKGLDRAPPPVVAAVGERPVLGEPIRADETPNPVPSAVKPSAISGEWPWFRGVNHDAVCNDGVRLARRWPEGGPKRLWTVELGEGYAAAAVSRGCVYVLDHVREADRSADTMRCLSLDDGKEIWRNSYPVDVPPHHGMSRTVAAVVGKHVVSFGPRCHVVGWDAETGKGLWLLDLVRDFGATVPPWYAGQCPLVDVETDRLILAPGGKALLMAVDYRSGQVVWESPNPRGWVMTHVSIMPMQLGGRRMYVYCGKGGVAGVDANSGEILWETTDWQISMATCPSPVILGDGKIFFCGGYNAGSLILQVEESGARLTAKTLVTRSPKVFGSEQQTPVLFHGHLYGIRQKDQQLVCLDLEGNEVWNSGRDKFGSAPYLVADGLIYVMNDHGLLTMAEATPSAYKPLARAQVIDNGVTCWGPMAMVAGRLIVRDLTRMVCLDVREGDGG